MSAQHIDGLEKRQPCSSGYLPAWLVAVITAAACYGTIQTAFFLAWVHGCCRVGYAAFHLQVHGSSMPIYTAFCISHTSSMQVALIIIELVPVAFLAHLRRDTLLLLWVSFSFIALSVFVSLNAALCLAPFVPGGSEIVPR